LRTVEKFEQRYADFPGLNLTFEVREGIVKHSRDYDAKDFPELAEYLLEQRPPLEAQLIDLTDEIAYSIADLDDGVEARILTREQVRRGVPVFARLYEEVEGRYPAAQEKLKFNETLKRVLDRLVTDLITHTRGTICASGVQQVEDVRRFSRRLFAFSPTVDAERRQIKEFLYRNVYFSPVLERDKRQAEQVISELFAFFMKSPRELPESYQDKMRQEPLHRIVCDYVAGMTDSYILEQHRKFCSPKKLVGKQI
jgi:dGTPase